MLNFLTEKKQTNKITLVEYTIVKTLNEACPVLDICDKRLCVRLILLVVGLLCFEGTYCGIKTGFLNFKLDTLDSCCLNCSILIYV